MKNNYTAIAFLIDKSGSMNSIRDDVIGGFNRFIDDQKRVPGECTISLYQFRDWREVVYKNQKIQDAPYLTNKTFVPSGMTALLDAVGQTINSVGESLSKLPESERPSKVLFVIFTDGQENVSKEFNKRQIGEMIKHQEDNYNWNFVFLGANQDSFHEAGGINISSGSTMNYVASAVGVADMYSSLSNKTAVFRSAAPSEKLAFDDEDRSKQKV